MFTRWIKGRLVRALADARFAVPVRKAIILCSPIMPRFVLERAFKAMAVHAAAQTTVLDKVEFIVYYGEPKAQSHFHMWDTVFSPCAGQYMSVFRHAKPWQAQMGSDTVIPVANIAQSEALFARMPNLKAIFYPANNGLNLQAVRNSKYQHVFLGHGDSNKASSANKAFRLYDEVWVAGQAHQDRFQAVPGDFSAIKFRIIGQPWMADWLDNRPADTTSEDTDWGYFPTWRGYYRDSDYSSMHLAPQIADIAQKYAGEHGAGHIKLHPWATSAQKKTAHKQMDIQRGHHVVDPTSELRDVLNRPLRFVVCDISAALTECLYLNVPIFLFEPGGDAVLPLHFHQQNGFCYIFKSPDELEALMQRVLGAGDDVLSNERQAARSYIFDLERTKTGQFYKELDRLSKDVSQPNLADQ